MSFIIKQIQVKTTEITYHTYQDDYYKTFKKAAVVDKDVEKLYPLYTLPRNT